MQDSRQRLPRCRSAASGCFELMTTQRSVRVVTTLLLLGISLPVRRAGAQPLTAFACTGGDACVFLSSLYYSTAGPGWYNNSGWAEAASGTPTPLCSLFGVSCVLAETLDYSGDYSDITSTADVPLAQPLTTVSTLCVLPLRALPQQPCRMCGARLRLR